MKTMKKLFMLAIVLMVATTFVFAEGQQEGGAQEMDKTANLTYVNWAEGIAYTHVAAVVLEEKMGYEVNLTAADVGPAYTAVAQGDMDAFMETWLPVLHKDYVEQYKEDIVDLGTVYEGTQVGLVIPSYMAEQGVSSISDLKKEEAVERLDGEITGIDAGAGVMQTTENEAIPAYGLDEAGYRLVASSGPAMTAALQKAIQNEEWIVVTGWNPHWKFGMWDLQFLEQDGKQIWGTGVIKMMGRKNLEQDKPELYQFLNNMFFEKDEMGDLLVAYRNADDPMEMAREWVKNNEDVVADWIPEM